jgi:hypothetical protein
VNQTLAWLGAAMVPVMDGNKVHLSVEAGAACKFPSNDWMDLFNKTIIV